MQSHSEDWIFQNKRLPSGCFSVPANGIQAFGRSELFLVFKKKIRRAETVTLPETIGYLKRQNTDGAFWREERVMYCKIKSYIVPIIL